MKKKSIFSLAALVAVAVVFAFILQSHKKNNQAELNIVAETNSEVSVRAAVVGKQDLSTAFTANGTFLPVTRAQVSAELGGQVEAIYVEEGDVVKPGQVIANLTGDKTDVSLNNAKANLETAVSALARYEAAFKTGGITELQLDQAKLQVANAQAQYKSAELNSGDTRIRSKVGGIVNKKLVEVGTVIGPGTGIIEVVDITSLKLKVEVDEMLVSRLSVGEEVKIKPSVGQETFSGKISFIAPASNGALKFPVEITMDNQQGKLRAGMYATASFSGPDKRTALTLHREAFVGSLSDKLVFVVRQDTALLTEIQTGENFGDRIEVLGGLKEGDVVVTSGQINLKDKTPVRILE